MVGKTLGRYRIKVKSTGGMCVMLSRAKGIVYK
jgi:hypothetical protein